MEWWMNLLNVVVLWVYGGWLCVLTFYVVQIVRHLRYQEDIRRRSGF